MLYGRLLEQLATAEGFRSKPYKDTLGRWTIGFGDTRVLGIKVTQDTPPLSYQAAVELMRADAFSACIAAQGIFENFNYFDHVRQEVLANMAFNLGGAGLARFVKMNAALMDVDFRRAAAEMKDSRWFNQVGKRAKRLYHQMLTGEHN